ncbi:MAG: ATP-grasp domain-containing protein [Polyangiaceae bacterium]|nr:ATP-grasp domain-containing protein [Polyangiaceae bacterium]
MDPFAHSPTRSPSSPPPGEGATILCISSYFKGNPFLEQCKRQGWRVILLTTEQLLGKPWARDHIDEVFAVPSLFDQKTVVNVVSFLARTRDIRRIAALDDYDVEMAAHLREHLRAPGMGETTARYFRDKLAMRARARDRNIPVPDFVHVLNHERIAAFLREVPPPWLLKPRSAASAIGIKKLWNESDAWAAVNELGDAQSNHLIERMIPGDVFHVDAIISERNIVLAEAHQYRRPLLEVMQEGGIFATHTVRRGSPLERDLLATNAKVVEHLGLVRGVMHTEFIRSKDDGTIYFLESAARVGGAHIAELVEASTGVNLWKEWARIELSQGEAPYVLPERRHDYGGLMISLARQEKPDTSSFTDPEIVWRLDDNPYHIGFILRSGSLERIEELLAQYEARVADEHATSLPPPKSPTA